MIGYKAFDKDLKCRGFQFEVGKTYSTDRKKEVLQLCTNTVFHFCRELHRIEAESDYKLSECRVCEVIATGDIVGNGSKYGTNKIKILRELSKEEKKEYCNCNTGNCNTGDCNIGNSNTGNRNTGNSNTGDRNTGNSNTGDSNTGDWNMGNRNTGNWNTGKWNTGNCNTGDWNTGNRNTGDWNTGDWNTGNWNTGDWNTGNCNRGDWNTGNRNTGNCNTGDWNTGDCNMGNRNTGNRNTGNRNTGNRNTGDCNTGNWNTGDWNTGFFNTITPDVLIFDKKTEKKRGEIRFPSFLYFDTVVWVSHDTATNEEKTRYKKEIEVAGGFLKKIEYKDAFRLAYDNASTEEHEMLFKLPNFDAEIFKKISGIDTASEYAAWKTTRKRQKSADD